MSRNVLILMVVLGVGITALIVLPKMRSHDSAQPVPTEPGQAPVTAQTPPSTGNNERPPLLVASGAAPQATASQANPATAAGTPLTAGVQQVTRNPPGQGAIVTTATDTGDDADAAPKPLPVLEKNYFATTNHDDRLDILMDIADTPSGDSIKVLTRLFSAETDTELKIDLLDSLLAIDGFKDEKLEMLKLGVHQGLPVEVRQSAIDGLIDLDDPRVIAVFNGLLNDPEEDVREAAKDALEMLQPETPVKR